MCSDHSPERHTLDSRWRLYPIAAAIKCEHATMSHEDREHGFIDCSLNEKQIKLQFINGIVGMNDKDRFLFCLTLVLFRGADGDEDTVDFDEAVDDFVAQHL